MTTTVLMRDESMIGESLNVLEIELPEERMTVEELIRSRVYQEVKDFNVRTASAPLSEFKGLVQPTEREISLNGQKPSRQPIDWKRHFDRAIRAFQQNQILVLVDGEQVSSLSEEITISSSLEICFLRLTMLTGG